MNYTIESLQPFGAIIQNQGTDSSIGQFSPEQIRDWVREYKIIVFRGYQPMPKQELALYGQQLGKPLQWEFGAINELKVKPDTENYIFTDHAVPMHWDGAFVGTIPHIILFQCLVAPKPEDLGGTTFCDSSAIVNRLSPEQKERWKNITISYTTKKVVHYGGTIRQKLVQKHEVDDIEVLRYAEPVDDLNPVSLSIEGLNGQSETEFIAAMRSLLYHPDYLYTHRWQQNDIVLADNHNLLHGREAFKNPNERYIQRINILHRPEGFSLKRFIENSFTIRRKEFFVAELPIFLIPLLMNISGAGDFSNPLLYLGLLAIILLFNIGDMINCYVDYKLDAIFKSHLSNAVYELGRNNVKWQIILSGVFAMILTAIVAVQSDQRYLIPLTFAGTIIGLQYSAKPFKFKSRGLWQILCLWGIIFFGPMLYTAIVTAGFPSLLQLSIFSLYGFHQMGIILLNTAEDYTEDKADGLNTIVIRLGLHRAMRFAWGLVIACGIGMQLTLALWLYNKQVPLYLYLSLTVFTIGWLMIVAEFWKVVAKINKENETEAIKTIKKNGMKVPRWLKIGAYSFLFPIAVYFTWNLLL